MSPFTDQIESYYKHSRGECNDPHDMGCTCVFCEDKEKAERQLSQYDRKDDGTKAH